MKKTSSIIMISSLSIMSVGMDHGRLPALEDERLGGKILVAQDVANFKAGAYVRPLEVLGVQERPKPQPRAVQEIFSRKYDLALKKLGKNDPYSLLLHEVGIRLGIFDAQMNESSDSDDEKIAS